jgi:hypothetical protein
VSVKAKKKLGQCDATGCDSKDAWRCDIPTSWFRGDDVVLRLCAEHRKPENHQHALTSEKAKRQMA